MDNICKAALAEVDVVTRNMMVYPKEVLVKALKEYRRKNSMECGDCRYCDEKGVNTVDNEELLALIADFIEKHPLAKELGGEYIYQNDKAQEDAISLVANIFDNCF